MHLSNSNPIPFSITISICLLLFLSGCAAQRWSDPIPSEGGEAISEIILAMQERETLSPQSMDANARIFLDGPGTDAAIHGYLQLNAPSFLKFIISNPLGMLAYAFASNGSSFQILDSSKHLHIRGNIRPLAIRRDLPLILVQGEWFAFLNQRLPTTESAILQVTKDISDQTFWLQFAPPPGSRTTGEQWIHLDAKQQLLLGYLFLDNSGEIVAEISYGDERREVQGDSTAARNILISELPWGTEIRIELRDIRTDTQFIDTDFTLPVPTGYFKQLQP